ncbi:MAG: hypothetical protein ACI4QA_07085 [Candidatus Spyradosoma sp.]
MKRDFESSRDGYALLKIRGIRAIREFKKSSRLGAFAEGKFSPKRQVREAWNRVASMKIAPFLRVLCVKIRTSGRDAGFFAFAPTDPLPFPCENFPVRHAQQMFVAVLLSFLLAKIRDFRGISGDF